MTAQGLGERNEVTGAGNPVLCDVQPRRAGHNGQRGDFDELQGPQELIRLHQKSHTPRDYP